MSNAGEPTEAGAPPTAISTYGGRSPFAPASKPPVLHRLVPLAASLHGYNRERLKRDVVAGLTVAALAVPAAMAFAELAGLPVTAGLYALLLPVLGYAGLSATKRGVIGPEGAVALLIATALAPLAAAGSPEYVALAAALAVLVGAVFLIARLLRIGWIADYFSQAVLVGYITGVAVLMALGQLSKLTGVSSDAEGEVLAALDIVTSLGSANRWTIALSVISLASLAALRRFAPRWPSALIVVTLSIAASWALDLEARGVALTGSVPAGLPQFERPDVTAEELASLALSAVAIFLVSYSDGILTARSFAAKRRESVDPDQELVAFGAANIAAGFTQGMPIGVSGSRTAVNDGMRATSQVSGLASVAAVAVVLVFLTEPIQYLPSAVLGAVILFASLMLINAGDWQALRASSRSEVAIAVVAAVMVVAVGVLSALAVAVLLSLIDVIRRVVTPDDAVLGWSSQEGRYVDVRNHPDCALTPGVVVYRFRGRLFFANAHFFKRRLWAAVDGAPRPVRHVVLDASGISGIDASAVGALSEVHAGCLARNITLEVGRLTNDLRERFEETGLTETIGVRHYHSTIEEAVKQLRQAPGASGEATSRDPQPQQ